MYIRHVWQGATSNQASIIFVIVITSTLLANFVDRDPLSVYCSCKFIAKGKGESSETFGSSVYFVFILQTNYLQEKPVTSHDKNFVQMRLFESNESRC